MLGWVLSWFVGISIVRWNTHTGEAQAGADDSKPSTQHSEQRRAGLTWDWQRTSGDWELRGRTGSQNSLIKATNNVQVLSVTSHSERHNTPPTAPAFYWTFLVILTIFICQDGSIFVILMVLRALKCNYTKTRDNRGVKSFSWFSGSAQCCADCTEILQFLQFWILRKERRWLWSSHLRDIFLNHGWLIL